MSTPFCASVLLITKGDPKYKHCQNFASFELFRIETYSLYSFTSIANQKSVRYSVSISYFTNISTNIVVQNVNKVRAFAQACTSSLTTKVMTKDKSKLYFKILKTWKNWESTRITSIPFPFLRTSFLILSGQIPVPATQIPFSHSKNRSIPVAILPLQDPQLMFHTFVFYKAYDHESFRVHYGIYEKLKLTQTK